MVEVCSHERSYEFGSPAVCASAPEPTVNASSLAIAPAIFVLGILRAMRLLRVLRKLAAFACCEGVLCHAGTSLTEHDPALSRIGLTNTGTAAYCSRYRYNRTLLGG